MLTSDPITFFLAASVSDERHYVGVAFAATVAVFFLADRKWRRKGKKEVL